MQPRATSPGTPSTDDDNHDSSSPLTALTPSSARSDVFSLLDVEVASSEDESIQGPRTRSRTRLRTSSTPANRNSSISPSLHSPRRRTVTAVPRRVLSADNTPSVVNRAAQDSDSSSDEQPTRRDTHIVNMTSNTRNASVLPYDGSKNPPVLTSGIITPRALSSWYLQCENFILSRDVPADKAVARCATGLQDDLVSSWYLDNLSTFVALGFDEFMGVLRGRWLKADWQAQIITELHRMVQGKDENWSAWSEKVERTNGVLRGTSSIMDDAWLRILL